MPIYAYRAYDRDGALSTGQLNGASRNAVIEALKENGHFPLEVTESGTESRERWWNREVFGTAGLSVKDLALFTRELATLVKADLPIDEAMRIVSLQPLMPGKIKKVTNRILNSLREGNSLSASMATAGSGFPEYYWALIQAGEVSGSTADVLEDLSVFLERSNDVRAQVGSALVYPAILLVSAGAALAIILTTLLPTIVPLFKDAGVAPPPTLQFLVGVQSFLARYWLLLCLLSGGLAVGITVAFQNKKVALRIDRMLLRWPVIGNLIANKEMARCTRTLGTLSRNGVPMLQAVRLSESVLRNRAFVQALVETGENLREGGTLSDPIVRSGLFSALAVRLIMVGEQTGQLDVMLIRVATIYEASLQRQLVRMTSLITPVLTLLIGGVVGGLILSVISAILSVNDLAFK